MASLFPAEPAQPADGTRRPIRCTPIRSVTRPQRDRGGRIESGQGAAGERQVTSDMDLVQDVIRAAVQPGYFVSLRGQYVFRVDGPQLAQACPRYEADAVHQLLDSGWLTLGGRCYTVTCDTDTVEVNEVLVPKRTRATASRWAALRPTRGR